MGPTASRQLAWGIATALLALALILVLAFVPDPFLRQRRIGTRFDNVESLAPGAPVYFRGAQIGSVRSVVLDPPTRLFDVELGIRRDWRPSACSFAQVASSNPLAPPHVELVAIETGARSCPQERLAAACDGLAPQAQGEGIEGCRRSPDLFEAAGSAVSEAASAAHAANGLATQLAALMSGPDRHGANANGGRSPKQVVQDSMVTVALLRRISERLDQGFVPGKGDIALTLANMRRASGTASEFDVTGLNAAIAELQAVVKANQDNIAGMLAEGRQTTAQSRALIEAISASLATTSTNLARVSDNVGALTERLSADPTYAVRGDKFTDPPPPGAKP